MDEKRLQEYRALAGFQLQFADRGDSHKVMEMQEAIEGWIGEKIKIDILVSYQGLKAQPMREINCSLSAEEIKAYRILVADAYKAFDEKGWEAWRDAQPKIELFVQGAIERHVFEALKPFIKISKN